jgi:FemAB-related protein (PEP-CTERM system-associated)
MNSSNPVITIRKYTEADKNNWDYYVMQHSQSTIFHLTRWKKVIEKTFGHKSHYLMAVQAASSPPSFQASQHPGLPVSQPKVTGILPLFRIKSYFFGHYLISVPFAELGGPLADNEIIEQQLVEKAIELTRTRKCDYLELRNEHAISDLIKKSLYYNFKKEIFPDPDQNMQAIPRKARRMIRQGIKFGLYSEFGNHFFHDFYEILAKSYHQLGTPIFSKRFFRTFLDEFGKDAQILVVYDKKGTPVAGVLSFFYKDQVLPFYAGSLFEYRKLAPNDFMYWELMKHACERGFKVFDFGRSKIDTGSYHFKRHWGFKPVSLSYQYYLNRINELPNLSPANPKYQKKIELWKKMPFKVTKILGPPIAKYLA